MKRNLYLCTTKSTYGLFVPFRDDFIPNKTRIRDEANRIFTFYAHDATAHPRQNRREEASGAYRLHD